MLYRRSVLNMISASLDSRRDSESDVQPRRFVKPIGRTGFHIVLRECNDEPIVVAGSRAFAPGTHVQTARFSGRSGEAIVTEPVPNRKGASQFPVNIVIQDIDILRIISADPAVVEAGFSGIVRLTGIGFLDSPLDTFTCVIFNPDTGLYDLSDPLASISSVTFVNSTTVDVELTVLSSAGEHSISIDPRRG